MSARAAFACGRQTWAGLQTVAGVGRGWKAWLLGGPGYPFEWRATCDKVTKECEATSVPCDQAQVAISGAQLLLVLCVSGDVAVGGLLLVLVEDVCWMP